MATFKKWLNNPYVTGVLLLFWSVVDLILVGREVDLSKSDWGTWVGSIGTVLTWIWTILLATGQARRQRREALQVARLRSASMTLRIDHAHRVLKEVSEKVRIAHQFDQAPDYFRSAEKILGELRLWTVEELVPLVPLPHNTALKLGEAADQIETARRALLQIAGLHTAMNGQRMKVAGDLHQLLEGTVRFLGEAIAECRSGTVAEHMGVG